MRKGWREGFTERWEVDRHAFPLLLFLLSLAGPVVDVTQFTDKTQRVAHSLRVLLSCLTSRSMLRLGSQDSPQRLGGLGLPFISLTGSFVLIKGREFKAQCQSKNHISFLKTVI